MSELDKNIPPVPEHTPPLREDDGKFGGAKNFAQTWTRWFIAVREKVNVLNESIINLAGVTGTGLLIKDGASWLLRTIQGTAGRISVANGSGSGGDPTIDLVATGVTSGTYGSSLKTPTITVDDYGRLTAVTDNSGIETALGGKLDIPDVTSTSATAGVATVLPATPLGYMTMEILIAGTPTTVKVPYYSP